MGRSKNYLAKSKFYTCFQPRNQKGRRIPINSSDKVNTELKKLVSEKHNKTFKLSTQTLYFTYCSHCLKRSIYKFCI